MNTAEFIYTVLLKPRPLRIAANAVLKALLPATCQVHGATIHLNPDDPVVSGALTLGVYEKEEIAFFQNSIKPDMVFVDVGANLGLYTALGMRRLRHPGRIIAIEPDPVSAAFLQSTIQANTPNHQTPHVSAHQVALSDTQGYLNLYRNPENKGDNRIYPDPLCPDAIPVPTTTLDALLADEGIASIDFIKIDVQGAEAKVIAGAKGVLANSPECILMSEFWPYGLAHSGSNPEHYLQTLTELGFKLFVLEGEKLHPAEDHQALIANCPGRLYRNLIGIRRPSPLTRKTRRSGLPHRGSTAGNVE